MGDRGPMFERFDSEARRVLVVAQDLARRHGHDYLGVEHILVALLDAFPALVDKAAKPAGVALADLRSQVVDSCGWVEGDRPVRSGTVTFTPRAKRALERTPAEAAGTGSTSIRPEHLLCALAEDGDGVAGDVLRGAGLGPGWLRSCFASGLAPDDETTPGAVALVARARALAVAAHAELMGTHHLLLAMTEEADNVASRVLRHLGISADEVTAAIRLTGGPKGTMDEEPDDEERSRVEIRVADGPPLIVDDRRLAEALRSFLSSEDVDLHDALRAYLDPDAGQSPPA